MQHKLSGFLYKVLDSDVKDDSLLDNIQSLNSDASDKVALCHRDMVHMNSESYLNL